MNLAVVDIGCLSYQASGEAVNNYCPVILTTARIAARPSSSNAALNMRISCVLGCTSRHTKAQTAATSPTRKRKDIKSRTIRVL